MRWFTVRLLFLILCGLLLMFASWDRATATDLPTTPNFVFIFVDDQSWSGTSIAMMPGNELSRTPGFHMPNLEQIASRGMVFSQAYASHPKCECSRAALLMGRSTTSLNAVDKFARNWTAPSSNSLANTLKRANSSYRAAHFGKWQWPQTPESMGYDASDGITMNEDGDSTDPNDPKQSFGITRRAHAFMEKQVREGHPFYLQLSYYAPHSKSQALASTLKKYEGSAGGGGKGGRSGGAITTAMIEDLDTCIGRLLEKLEQLGMAEKTYLIYMSDNGGGTQLLKGGKSLVDEGGLRVPLIVSGPGITGGAYCDEPVVGYDILPTVLDFAAPGFALPQGVEGGSWKPVLMNAGIGKIHRPIDRLVFHHDVEVPHPQTAMRKGNWKLLHYWDTKESFLYDLSMDLGERNNLAAEKPDVVANMLGELKAHVKNGLDEKRFAALDGGQFQGNEHPKGDTRGGGGKGKEGKRKEGKENGSPDRGQKSRPSNNAA